MRCVAVLLASLLALSALSLADTPAGFDPHTWESGAPGLYGALRSIEEGDARPMVVYFYTDWCGYCRQFERELLGTTPVKQYFGDLLAVRLNPESGDEERKIARYYGVSGFPAFFVQGSRSRSMVRIERMVMEDGRPRIMTPDEFIAAVAGAAAQ